MWCCHACNSKKSNIWPTDGLAAAGYRYVRPDQDDPNDHYKLGDNGSVLIEPLTPAGKWTHNIIDLNRGALREVRAARQALFESAEAIAHGLGRLSASKRGMDQLKPEVRAKYLRAIEQAKGQWKTLEAAMDDASFGDFIRQMNKSSNIQDPDEQREHTKRRREFLKEIKALHPDYPD